MSRYEAHITVVITDEQIAEDNPDAFVAGLEMIGKRHGWSFSVFLGDPTLDPDFSLVGGASPTDAELTKQLRFYLTGYAEVYYDAQNKMLDVAKDLTNAGYAVVRQKIEMEVFDWKRDPHV